MLKKIDADPTRTENMDEKNTLSVHLREANTQATWGGLRLQGFRRLLAHEFL